MGWKFLLPLLAISGCADFDFSVDDKLAPVAEVLLHDPGSPQAGPVIFSDQPEPYRSIINQNYDEVKFRLDYNLESLKIQRMRAKQQRFPELKPIASLGKGGVAVGQGSVRQVLFNGKAYEAQYKDADIKALNRQLILLSSLNGDASSDIETYHSYHQNTEREKLLRGLVHDIEGLLQLAKTRLRGGLATADEVTLFKLKLSEVQTEAQIARSNAAVELAALDGLDVSTKPTDFNFSGTHLPIEVLIALAEREDAQSNFNLAKVSARPKVVLQVGGGIDLATGKPISNAGLSVEGAPIKIGGNTDIQLAEQEVFLAERELEETVTKVETDTKRLEQQIAALELQRVQTASLARQARARLNAFDDQFLAGSVSLSEAGGMIDTLRRSLEAQIDVDYRILGLQRELATKLGHFWSL